MGCGRCNDGNGGNYVAIFFYYHICEVYVSRDHLVLVAAIAWLGFDEQNRFL